MVLSIADTITWYKVKGKKTWNLPFYDCSVRSNFCKINFSYAVLGGGGAIAVRGKVPLELLLLQGNKKNIARVMKPARNFRRVI